MYLTPDIIQALERRFGTPAVRGWEAEFVEREMALMRGCLRKERAHDVTLLIHDESLGLARFALIRKPWYPAGLYRPPSGGVERGEAFEVGAEREAWEETGLAIRLERYVLRVHARFTLGEEAVDWTTHVFSARALTHDLCVQDTHEVAEACWATPEAVHAVMRPRMLAAGSAGFVYRVMLQDGGLGLLSGVHP